MTASKTIASQHQSMWDELDRDVDFAHQKSLAYLSEFGNKAEKYKSLANAINKCHQTLNELIKSFDEPYEDNESRKLQSPPTNAVAHEHLFVPNDSGEQLQTAGRRKNPPRTPDGSPKERVDPFDLYKAQMRNKSMPSFPNSTVSNTVNNSPLVREHSPKQENSTYRSFVDCFNSVSPTVFRARSGIESQRSSRSPISPRSDFGYISQTGTRRPVVNSSPAFSTWRYRSPIPQYSRNYNYRNGSTSSRQFLTKYDRPFRPRESRTRLENRYSRRSPRRSRSRSHQDTTRHRSSTRHSRSRISPERGTRRQESCTFRPINRSPAQVTTPFRPPSPPLEVFKNERSESAERSESSAENKALNRKQPRGNQKNTEQTGIDEFKPQTQIPNEQSVLMPPNGPMPYHPHQYSFHNYHGQGFFHSMNPPMHPPGVMPLPYNGLSYHQPRLPYSRPPYSPRNI